MMNGGEMQEVEAPHEFSDQLGVIRDLIECCRAWEPNVRLLGNVRAGDAADAMETILALVKEQDEAIKEDLKALAVGIRFREALEEVDDYLDNAPTVRAIVRRALNGDA